MIDPSCKYFYTAVVSRVVDADTIDVTLDLGLKIYHKQRLRLARVDAWEVRGEERPQGLIAKSFVELVCPPGCEIHVQTIKDKTGKYGRYLAEVYYEKEGQWNNLSDKLVELGHAHY